MGQVRKDALDEGCVVGLEEGNVEEKDKEWRSRYI